MSRTAATIDVPEVHCQHCVSSIEGALTPMDGVESAMVDLATTSVRVVIDDDVLGIDQVVTAIEDQGYEVAGTA